MDHHQCHNARTPHAPGPGEGEGSRLKRILHKYVYGNVILMGILSLAWLIVRSGRKPTRMNYPCQKAALANTMVLFGGAAVPVAARMPRFLLGERADRPWLKALTRVTELAAAIAIVVAIVVTATGLGGPAGRTLSEMKAAAASLRPPVLRSGSADASSIFVAQQIPPASEHGVDYLIQTMAGNGLDFFRSTQAGAASGPNGLIGKDDIVLIKVNGEWRFRGGTNTDVVKGLVDAIVRHPDGFTGEVAIVENGQWDSYMDNGQMDNANPDACNAQDHTQSFNDVALSYEARGYRVSTFDWTAVQTADVNDFDTGDPRSGYVYMPSIQEGYPKFTTRFGTQISLRNGQWTGSGYNNARVKFLNVPVLKDHGYAGVTCAVKHFMGFQDLWQRTQNAPHTPMVTEGLFGKIMVNVRMPDLNIADAIWVTPAGGPNGPYETAVRLDKLVASQDPIALDYYCGKYLLMPVSGNPRHDPNNMNGSTNAFRQMLASTRDQLLAGGKQATMDEAKMNVYTNWAPQDPPATTYEYFLAEGCTAYGFETWVLVANPNDTDTTVYISYLTDQGPINKDPVVVPARSRLTVNAASDAWAMNAGVRVGSNDPVYVERSMYWNNRAEGHDSIASAPATDWYLADGHTADGFETWVEILNPRKEAARAQLTYFTPAGQVAGPGVDVPGYSRKTVFVADTVSGQDVATRVTADAPVVVERSIYWNGRRGGMGSQGVAAPSADWYFAEGATHSGFETYILLFNPQAQDATATLELMTGSGAPVSQQVAVPAGTRRTVKLNEVVPGADVSTRVRSTALLVAERSMLWGVDGGRAGHATTGMTAPKTSIFMPEGCTAYGFETWLLLQNPGTADAQVGVFAMTEGGEQKIADVTVGPGQRKTLRLNDHYQGNLSVRVTATTPVAAERAVYWNSRGGGTGSIGY